MLTTPPTQELSQAEVPSVRRLHALLGLASAPAQSNRASRVAKEAVAALGVRACVFHRLGAEAEPEAAATVTSSEIDGARCIQFAARLAAEVTAAGEAITINNLAARYPDDPLLSETGLACYLGVPLFDPKGAVLGVMAVMDGVDRQFDEEDEWWLRTAAHLTGASLACESLEAKLQSLEQALSQRPAPAASPQAEGDGKPAESGKLSVLVIDDDRAVNNVLRRFLTREGHQVDCAFDGLEAMRLFQPSHHDVVITDIVMPHMNGWELVAALRVRAPEVPILLITGFSRSDGAWNREFLRKQGVLALLNKPFDLNHLSGIIDDIRFAKRPDLRG